MYIYDTCRCCNIFLTSGHLIDAFDTLLGICTPVISVVLSLDEHLSQTNTLCVQNFVKSRCTVVLFGTSLLGDALLNVSRTLADDLDAK
jgi:hypothetical protein